MTMTTTTLKKPSDNSLSPDNDHGKEMESLTVATAPLTPHVYKANNDEYDKSAPTSASTLSSAATLEINHQSVNDSMNGSGPIPSSCSSPYEAFLFSSEWLGSGELQLPDMISRSSSQGGNDDTDSVASGAYFDDVDLDASNWMEAIRMDGPTFGFAMVALATAVVHPVLFVAGALTAFGTLHAVGVGYEYCNNNGGKAAESSEQTAASWEHTLLRVCFKDATDEPTLGNPECNEAQETVNNSLLLPLPEVNEAKVVSESPGESSAKIVALVEPAQALAPVPTEENLPKPAEPLSKDLVEQAYAPLDNTVVEGVSFPGLHAIEFFNVFFKDDCPYTFYELQKQRGDLDIVYGKWQELEFDQPVSLQNHTGKLKSKSQPSLLDDWKSCFQGRVLTFKAKTNNFIGPVYATTRKTQRVLLHHKTLIVMESRTDLSDIPFSDRFYVLERWIIRAEKVKDESNGKYKYVSTLHATSQVVFLQSCQFASQIKTKSASTIRDLVKCWYTMAKEALKLAEQKKRLRLKHEQEGDSENDCYETDLEDDVEDSMEQSKEKNPPAHEEEGIEMAWPGQADSIGHEKTSVSKPTLRHLGSAPLPGYRGRGLQGIKRSFSSLWNNRR